jgi:hypothetical protein
MSNEGMKEFLPEEQRATRIISAVKAVSEQVGRSMAQVALASLRHQCPPNVAIIGGVGSLPCKARRTVSSPLAVPTRAGYGR